MTNKTTLLRIDASGRGSGSYSRKMADVFCATWTRKHPHGVVLRRDVGAEPPAFLTDDTITGFYTPPERMTEQLRSATALSDQLIEELLRADELLVASPIYNFSVPATFKAWVDQVVRIGRTFSSIDGKVDELVTGKRATILMSYGLPGYSDPAVLASFDFLKRYFAALFGFLGFRDMRFVALEGTSADPAALARNLESAIEQAAAAA
jgi:FMN-dependent NADH-azoreductase